MKHNRIIGMVLLVFICWWAYLTTQLPETTMVGEPGPKFFPNVILSAMAFLSMLLFFNKDKKKTEMSTDETESGIMVFKENPFPMSHALKLFAVFLGSIILIYFLGFNIGMILGLTAILYMIGWKLFPRAIVFSTVVTVAVYLLFDWLMRIPLPAGKLF